MGKMDQYSGDYIDVLGLHRYQLSEIGEMYFINDMEPGDIASWVDVTVADVHGALWYYLRNRDEMKDRMGWDEYDSLE